MLEIGGAASRSLTESQSSFGPTLAVVADPVRITVRAPKRSASRPIAKVEKAAIKLCVVNASEIAEPRALKSVTQPGKDIPNDAVLSLLVNRHLLDRAR